MKEADGHMTAVGRYLGDKALILAQPRLSHGSFAIEAPGERLQLLLTNELGPQGQLALVLRPLQTLPGLKQMHQSTKVRPCSGLKASRQL